MNKRQLSKAITAIAKHKIAIAKHRDALREIYEDLEAIIDSADDGLQNLEYAVDALSSHL